MGLCLENYSYAYPVSYITLNIQRQVLKMAFMDVQPEHPNGHTVITYDSLRNYEAESYYHGTWSPEYDQWLNIYAGWMLSPEYSRIAWNSALTYDMIFNQPVCYEFGLIKAPALLIVGELDRTALGKNLVPASVAQTMGNYPELGRVTAAKIPGCRLVELPGVGMSRMWRFSTTFWKPCWISWVDKGLPGV
jgi:hypothetical protein